MDAFFNKYREKLILKSIERNDCRIWIGTKSADKQYGVINYKCPIHHVWKQTKVHRLAYMIFNGNLLITPDLDCSHLCHNSLCINPYHISLEPHYVNNNRKVCLDRGICMTHLQYRDCMLT